MAVAVWLAAAGRMAAGMARWRGSGRRRRWLLPAAIAFGAPLALVACGDGAGDAGLVQPATVGPPAATGTVDGAAGAPPAPAGAGVRFGVAVEGADPGQLAEIEDRAGAEVGVVRVFARWDTQFPSSDHLALAGSGRRLHLSVRPRTDGGVVVPWADIAAATPGSDVFDRLQEWTRLAGSFGSELYFTLNHEPETGDSAPNGTAGEFVAAWRATVQLLRANGGEEVKTVLVLGRGPYADGTVAAWYPGDDVVDVVGVDLYNWYGCQGTDRPWAAPAELLQPAADFASARGKPLAIPEVASTEDPEDPTRKAGWIADLGEAVASPDLAERLEFVAWFSVHDDSWPDCAWEYDSSPASARALAALVTRFGSAGGS
jgi:hypothetical protein